MSFKQLTFILMIVATLTIRPQVALAAAADSMDKMAQAVYDRALNGDANAQYQLAQLYENGQGGMKKNLGSAVSWYEEAAHNGLKIALNRLQKLATQ